MDFLFQLSASQLKWAEQKHLYIFASDTVSMSCQSYTATQKLNAM